MPNKRTILIVDDDAELRDALVEQLALHEEFDAISADSGTKGVQAAKNRDLARVLTHRIDRKRKILPAGLRTTCHDDLITVL